MLLLPLQPLLGRGKAGTVLIHFHRYFFAWSTNRGSPFSLASALFTFSLLVRDSAICTCSHYSVHDGERLGFDPAGAVAQATWCNPGVDRPLWSEFFGETSMKGEAAPIETNPGFVHSPRLATPDCRGKIIAWWTVVRVVPVWVFCRV